MIIAVAFYTTCTVVNSNNKCDRGGVNGLTILQNGPECNDPKAPLYYVMRSFPGLLRLYVCKIFHDYVASNGKRGQFIVVSCAGWFLKEVGKLKSWHSSGQDL